MNEIKLTAELCAEDRARIDRLSNALSALCENIMPELIVTLRHCADATAAPVPELQSQQINVPAEAAQNAPQTVEPEKPNDNPPWEEKPATPEPATPAKAVSEAELRSLVQELLAAGKRDAVFSIIQKYAHKVSGVPEEKRPEAMELLKAVKEGKA